VSTPQAYAWWGASPVALLGERSPWSVEPHLLVKLVHRPAPRLVRHEHLRYLLVGSGRARLSTRLLRSPHLPVDESPVEDEDRGPAAARRQVREAPLHLQLALQDRLLEREHRTKLARAPPRRSGHRSLLGGLSRPTRTRTRSRVLSGPALLPGRRRCCRPVPGTGSRCSG